MGQKATVHGLEGRIHGTKRCLLQVLSLLVEGVAALPFWLADGYGIASRWWVEIDSACTGTATPWHGPLRELTWF
jgi:hypothetical protein